MSLLNLAAINSAPTMMEAALIYARAGVPVFPCHIHKSPRVDGSFHAANIDEAQIKEWWKKWPDASIGVPTGCAIGAWVLDVDLPAGPVTLAKIEEATGKFPETLTQITGSGGQHLFFLMLDNISISNSVKKIGPGLDVRGDGGYVIVSPSHHPSGNKYQWVICDAQTVEKRDAE